MTSDPFELRTSDGLVLRGTRNFPVGTPRGLVVSVHGFGEHHRRHDLLAETLSGQGFVIVRYDHRGLGTSDGSRGDALSFDQLLSDLDQVLENSCQLYSGLPLFLHGHSMGGGVVANWAIRRPRPTVRGLILSSPWLELRSQPHPLVQWVARGAVSLWPTLAIRTGIRAENLTSDPESMARYQGDPLIVKQISLRLVLGIIQAGQFTLQNAARLQYPALVIHGTHDRVTAAEASKRLAASAPQAALRLFEGLAHELHFEPRAPEVLKTILDWLQGQVT